jgi:hypothetical protein
MLGIVDGEIGGRGWPGGGIASPARGAYGPTCGAIETGAVCCDGTVVAGTAVTATADVGCGGGECVCAGECECGEDGDHGQ